MSAEATKAKLEQILNNLENISIQDEYQTGLDADQQEYIEQAIEAVRAILDEIG